MIELQRHAQRNALVVLAVFAAVLFAGIAGLVLLTIHAFGYERVVVEWQLIRPYVLATKWSTMVLVVRHWPSLARWLGERFVLPAEDVERLAQLRWRVAAALIVLELLIGQNLIGRLANVA